VTLLRLRAHRIALLGLLGCCSCAQLRRIDLPAIGTVGVEPPASNRVVVHVRRDGGTVCRGETMQLAEVVSLVQREAESAASSRIEWIDCSELDVLLVVDRDARFGDVDAFVSRLSTPDLAILRVFVAAACESTGEVGALAMHTPVDLGGSTPPERPVCVRIGFGGEASDPSGLVPMVRSCIDAGGSGFDPVVVCESAPDVPWGFVLRAVDAVLRGGARRVALVGRQPSAGSGRQALADVVQPDRSVRLPTIRFDGALVGREVVELPPVAFRRDGFAGVSSSFRFRWPIEAPPPPPQLPNARDR